MIEIIKRGTKKTCTCKNCGCYFSYEDEDINVETWIGDPALQPVFWTDNKSIKCPQCETKIVLEQIK